MAYPPLGFILGVFIDGWYLVPAPKVSRARHEYLTTHVTVLFSDVTDDARQTCGQTRVCDNTPTDFQVIPTGQASFGPA